MRMKAMTLAAMLAGVTGAVQSQGSVALYGALDAGVARVTGAGASASAVSLLAAGPLVTPRLGFRGSEDLGDGMKVNFILESELLPDVGGYAGVFYKRGAWVGVQGAAGELRLGRQNLEGYDYFARFDPLGGANLGGAINANAAGAAAGSGNIFNVFAIDRADNSVSLRLTAWNGLSARYTHAFGEVAGGGNRGNLDSLGVEYTGTSLEAAAYVYELRAAAGGLQNRGFGLFAAYRVGDVKLLAGHTQNEGHLTGGSKFKDSFVGMKWFVTPVWTVSAQLSSLNIQAIQAKPRVIGASLTCALSKRTQVYVLAARSNQDNGSRALITSLSKIPASDPGQPGANQSGIATGVAHLF